MKEELEKLVNDWEKWSRKKFKDAAHEEDPMGKRLIEHGAICYFNCAQDIKNLLTAKLSEI